MNGQELEEFEASRKAASAAIDIETCVYVTWTACSGDPYELLDGEQQYSRQYYVCEGDGDIIHLSDLPPEKAKRFWERLKSGDIKERYDSDLGF